MKLKVQAQHLQAGDIVGSGDRVVSVSAGAKTPAGKIEVRLAKPLTSDGSWNRMSLWGKYTLINVERYIKPHDLHIKYSRASDFTVHMENRMCEGCKPMEAIETREDGIS